MTMQNPNDAGAAAKSYTEAELQEHIRKATSTVQAENATLSRRLTEIGANFDAASDSLLKVNSELETLRTAGKLSEDAEGFARYEADARATIAAERRRLDTDFRIITVARLRSEFPSLTEAELTGMNTPTEMEIYALRNHSKAAAPPPADGLAADPGAPLVPPTPQLDRGGAGNGGGAESSSLRGAAKIEAGLRNMHDPLGVLPK